jgi:hypothetical protein
MFEKTLIAKAASAVVLATAASFAAALPASPIDAGNIAVPSFGNPLINVTVTGNLEQVYFFNLLSDAGSLTANYNWNPSGPTSFQGTLYKSDSTGTLDGASLATFYQDGSRNFEFSYGALTAGYYAFKFTANNAGTAGYSGQFTTYVPAPGVLALLGIGLIGMGAARRKAS